MKINSLGVKPYALMQNQQKEYNSQWYSGY